MSIENVVDEIHEDIQILVSNQNHKRKQRRHKNKRRRNKEISYRERNINGGTLTYSSSNVPKWDFLLFTYTIFYLELCV